MFQQMSGFRAASSARSRTATPLTNDEIRRAAPSVFAAEAHDSRSARYAYIPTSDILAALRNEGFEVFSAMQANCRSADRREHTKHLLRLRHVGQAGQALAVGDSVSEICMLNSHDGTSSYQMFAGVFRLACLNGLMVCESTVGGIRIPHSGKVKDRVTEGAFDILDGCIRVKESQQQMLSISLDPRERLLLAQAALTLRYDEADGSPIQAPKLLETRRHADTGTDLWTTFNVIQENVIKGGLPGRTAVGGRTRTREVKGIDQNVKLNKALWTLADEMAKLKLAH